MNVADKDPRLASIASFVSHIEREALDIAASRAYGDRILFNHSPLPGKVWRDVLYRAPSDYFIPDIPVWTALVSEDVPPTPPFPRRRSTK